MLRNVIIYIIHSFLIQMTNDILGEDVNMSRPTIQSSNDDVVQITTHPHIILPYKGFKGGEYHKRHEKVPSQFFAKNRDSSVHIQREKIRIFFFSEG